MKWRPEKAALGARLSHAGLGRELRGGCAERNRRAAALGRRLLAVRRSAAREGERRARHHRIQAAAPPAGASVIDVSFSAEGVIVTVRLRRRRRVCAYCGQTGRQLEIHDRRVKRWRHLDLGASRCCDRVRAAPAALPRLRRPAGAGPVGAAGRGAHPRLRRRRRVAGAADGVRADHPAAAGRLAHDRPDRRARRRRPPRRSPPRRAGLYRRRRDLLSAPSPLPDHRRRPRTGAIVWCQPGRNSATLQRLLRRAR